MDNIKLVFPTKADEKAAKEYFNEHVANGETSMSGDSCLDSAQTYDLWLEKIDNDLHGEIYSIIFFAKRESDEKIVGMINVRYPYLGYVQVYGHIGYGVRPSERGKGYATKMLWSALEFCKSRELEKVLLTCVETNTASEKVITKCGGEFECTSQSEIGTTYKRFWIKI